MLGFAGRHFRTAVEVFLWLNLISSVIGGGITGYSLDRDTGAVIGAIIGLVVGFISNILIGGLIAKIINIDENIEIIKDNSIGIEDSKVETPRAKNSSNDLLTL